MRYTRATAVRNLCAFTAASAALFGALTVPAGAQADTAGEPIVPVLERATQGRQALAKIKPRLGEIARTNGMPAQRLQNILATDETSWLDKDGRLFYQEPVVPAAARAERPSTRAATGPAFQLHSKPGSSRVIYLDFDGHVITGTAWNASTGVPSVTVTPYDTDGVPSVFSTAEQAIVRETWQRVAEDYAPFDVDVTTQAPLESSITRSSATDTLFGTRVLIDPTTWYYSRFCTCGGVAYVGVYGLTANHSYYQPALVFTRGVGNVAKNIAEAASHEAGHNLGLSHDGTSTSGYYAGHGAWAPIMGVGYSRAITQWSRGEYSGANNREDDFAVINRNGVGMRGDDHGNSIAAARPIAVGATVAGYNADMSDVDVFRVTVAAGRYSVAAFAAPVGANLDIRLELLNAAGAVLQVADPAAGQVNAGTPTGLNASLVRVLTAGTYYIRVDNTGYGSPLTTGYSAYGSRGAFWVRMVPA